MVRAHTSMHMYILICHTGYSLVAIIIDNGDTYRVTYMY